MDSPEVPGIDGFIGEYSHSIDAKGRVIIPQKFRDELGTTCVVSKGLDGCLWIHPVEEWRVFQSRIRSLSKIDRQSRQFVRFFLPGAVVCELDKQGRILIPAALRRYGGISKDIVLAGMDTRIELWSAERWEEETEVNDSNMENIAEHLAELGVEI